MRVSPPYATANACLNSVTTESSVRLRPTHAHGGAPARIVARGHVVVR
jgi:hypothetical protein